MNNVKTVMLLAFLTTLLWWVSISLFPNGGFWFGLVIAAFFNLGAYFFSDKFALKMSRAKPVSEEELPEVYAIVHMLADSADMPMPRIYVMDSPQPNAFATGRNPRRGVVAVTTGLLQIMSSGELEAVLAHELSHIRNRDILISSVAAMLAAALTILARMAFWFGGGGRNRNNQLGAIIAIVAMIVAPIAAILIRMAISRSREYQADRSGVDLTGQPLLLASALGKIGIATDRIPMRVNDAVSQLYIENPLKSRFRREGGIMKLLSTHPPIESRIRILEEMADPFS